MHKKGYDHPASQLNLPHQVSQADKLLALLVKDWDFLIEAHLRLGCTIAGMYHMGGGDSDEMVSAAWEGIVVAVDRIKNGHLSHDNITGYICTYIYEYCARARRLDCVIPCPRGQESKIRRVRLTESSALAPDDFTLIDTLEELDALVSDEAVETFRALLQEAETRRETARVRSRPSCRAGPRASAAPRGSCRSRVRARGSTR